MYSARPLYFCTSRVNKVLYHLLRLETTFVNIYFANVKVTALDTKSHWILYSVITVQCYCISYTIVLTY